MNHRYLYIYIILFGVSRAISQTNDSSMYYYNLGNAAAEKRDYFLADSFFTLSLSYLRHPDTYFNRATVRKQLGNTKGYCLDMGNAANMRDTIANKLFWKDCGSVDTLYYNDYHSIYSKKKFAYMDIIAKCNYTTDLSCKRFDYNGKLLAFYKATNNDTIFYASTSPPKYPENENNIVENLRYIIPKGDERNGKSFFFVSLSFTILENGSMTDINVSSIDVKKKYEEQIISVFKKYTKNWMPAQFNGRPVKFRKMILYTVEL